MLIMKTLLTFLSLVVVCLTPAFGQQVFYFPQVGDGASGDLSILTEIVLVQTGADTSVTIEFFDSSGAPMTVTLGDLGANSEFTFNMISGESRSLKTSGAGALQVGYARITSSVEGLGGTAVFTGTDVPSGVTLFEAGVPASVAVGDFTVSVDSLGRTDTGLAMLRPPTGQSGMEDVVLTLYDTSFNQIATTDVPLASGEKQAKFVNQFFEGDPQVVSMAQEMQGVLTVHSSDVAAVTLRQKAPVQPFPDGVTTLTTFPVTAGIPTAAVATSSLSLLSSGALQIALVTEGMTPRPGSVDYRVWDGDSLIGEYHKQLNPRQSIFVHRIAAGLGASSTRIDVRLADSSGQEIRSFSMNR